MQLSLKGKLGYLGNTIPHSNTLNLKMGILHRRDNWSCIKRRENRCATNADCRLTDWQINIVLKCSNPNPNPNANPN